MKHPTFNIFIMQPPGGKKKDKSMADWMKEIMKMSAEMKKMTKAVKDLPHTEHSGGG